MILDNILVLIMIYTSVLICQVMFGSAYESPLVSSALRAVEKTPRAFGI